MSEFRLGSDGMLQAQLRAAGCSLSAQVKAAPAQVQDLNWNWENTSSIRVWGIINWFVFPACTLA